MLFDLSRPKFASCGNFDFPVHIYMPGKQPIIGTLHILHFSIGLVLSPSALLFTDDNPQEVEPSIIVMWSIKTTERVMSNVGFSILDSFA